MKYKIDKKKKTVTLGEGKQKQELTYPEFTKLTTEIVLRMY